LTGNPYSTSNRLADLAFNVTSESLKDVRQKAKQFTITDVGGLAKSWAREMILWTVTAIGIGLFTAVFHLLEVWLAIVVSVVLFILAGIGNLALIGLPYISPKDKSTNQLRSSVPDVPQRGLDLEGEQREE